MRFLWLWVLNGEFHNQRHTVQNLKLRQFHCENLQSRKGKVKGKFHPRTGNEGRGGK